MKQYFGTYRNFETPSKKDASVLLGADNLAGDIYSIRIEVGDEYHRAWLINRFDQKIGYFDAAFSRELSLLKAKEWNMCAVLSFVAYTDSPDPGHFWGNMAVFAYDPIEKESFTVFIDGIAKRLSEGIRPDIDLSEAAVQTVIEDGGRWTPEKTLPWPKLESGSVYMKKRRSISEKMIEQGRKGNIGCYIGAWAFLLALVAFVLFSFFSCQS